MKYLILIGVMLTLIGCSTNAKVGRTWIDKDIDLTGLNGVLVVAVVENKKLRVLFEDDYVAELKKYGVKAQASHKLGLNRINPDNIIAVTQKADLDTVLVANYVGTTEYDVYNADTYYYGGAMAISSNGDSHSYYGYSYQEDGPASYYTTNKFVILVSSLYEVSNRKMVWNVVSSAQLAGDPVNLFEPFIETFIAQGVKDGLIK